MPFIEDLKNAVDNYETENCKTEIVSFSITGGGGSILQTGETFRFKVKVTNQSHLDMRNVKVRAIGTSFADIVVYGGRIPVPLADSPAFHLDAHQSYTTGFFYGRAKKATNGAKDIVKARIQSWDASLNHILCDHTGAGVAEGVLNKDIKRD